MIDYFLRFADQLEALSVMQAFTYTDDGGIVHLSQGGHQFALWEVGSIEGKDGWHVNLRVIDSELDVSALEAYKVSPKFPICVWA